MRTVLFFIAMSLSDIAYAIRGKEVEYNSGLGFFVFVVFVICVSMDVISFINSIK